MLINSIHSPFLHPYSYTKPSCYFILVQFIVYYPELSHAPFTIYLCTKQQNYCLAQNTLEQSISSPPPPTHLPYIMHVNINTKRFLKGNRPFHLCAGRTIFSSCLGSICSYDLSQMPTRLIDH